MIRTTAKWNTFYRLKKCDKVENVVVVVISVAAVVVVVVMIIVKKIPLLSEADKSIFGRITLA